MFEVTLNAIISGLMYGSIWGLSPSDLPSFLG